MYYCYLFYAIIVIWFHNICIIIVLCHILNIYTQYTRTPRKSTIVFKIHIFNDSKNKGVCKINFLSKVIRLFFQYALAYTSLLIQYNKTNISHSIPLNSLVLFYIYRFVVDFLLFFRRTLYHWFKRCVKYVGRDVTKTKFISTTASMRNLTIQLYC